MHKRCAMNTVNQSELKAKTDLTLSAGKRVWASMRLISRWSKKVGQVLFPIFQPIIKRSIWNPKQNWRWNETVTARALIKTDCTNANRLSPPNEPVRAELNNIAFIGKWRHEREDVCDLILLLYIRTLGYIYIFFFFWTLDSLLTVLLRYYFIFARFQTDCRENETSNIKQVQWKSRNTLVHWNPPIDKLIFAIKRHV